MSIFQVWFEYYKKNQIHFDHIQWDLEDSLTVEEKQIITRSIQQFQKGENSEGKHLFQFAKSLGDEVYVETIKLFIKEEQRHALVLRKLMDKHAIPCIKSHWVDGIFRFLRKLGGLENSLIVLITAEIIANTYYKALENATNSDLLKKICQQILIDEEKHIVFQSFTLNMLYEKKNFLQKAFSRSFHKILMAGTIGIVWLHHRKVLKKGNYTLKSLTQAIWQDFLASANCIKGKQEAYPLNSLVIIKA